MLINTFVSLVTSLFLSFKCARVIFFLSCRKLGSQLSFAAFCFYITSFFISRVLFNPNLTKSEGKWQHIDKYDKIPIRGFTYLPSYGRVRSL